MANERFDELAIRHDEQRAAWQEQLEEEWDETPIADALRPALEDVKNGEPALVDVVCQPR